MKLHIHIVGDNQEIPEHEFGFLFPEATFALNRHEELLRAMLADRPQTEVFVATQSEIMFLTAANMKYEGLLEEVKVTFGDYPDRVCFVGGSFSDWWPTDVFPNRAYYIHRIILWGRI